MTAFTVAQERAIRAQYRQVHARTAEAFTAFWLLWIIAGLSVELWALFNRRPGDTLSEQAWKWVTGVRNPVGEPAWCVWVGRVLILAACAWLGPHLAFGWWSS